MIERLRERPFTIIGVLIGVIAFGLILNGQRVTQSRVERVEGDVRIIRTESPCTGLSARQCARKLLDSLPPVERRAFLRRVQAEERRLARREARRRETARAEGRDPGPVRLPPDARDRVSGGSQGGSRPGGPVVPGSPGGTSGGDGSSNSPSAPSQPSPTPPTSRPPLIDPGPIGPVDLPPVDPCIPVVRPC